MPSQCANIFVKNSNGKGIYLYAHDGSKLPKVLASALRRGRDRWGDTASLTRIIMAEMTQNDFLGTTGFGISTSLMDNDHLILVVDDVERKVGLFGESGRMFNSFTFEQFIGYNAAALEWNALSGGITLANHDSGVNRRTTNPYPFS